MELCTEFIPVDRKADELQNQAVKSRLLSFCNDITCQDLFYEVGNRGNGIVWYKSEKHARRAVDKLDGKNKLVLTLDQIPK